jgi:lysophospholipase L1-like esterase
MKSMKAAAWLALGTWLLAACAAPAPTQRSPAETALPPIASGASSTPTASPTRALMRLVTLGDSMTAATNACGAGWPTYLAIPPVHNAGVGGDTTGAMLHRLISDVLAYHPTDVTIMGGTNDGNRGQSASTLANLRAIIEQVRASGARAWLLTIPPYEANWGLSSDAAVMAFNAQLRTLAASTGAGLIDAWSDLSTSEGTWLAGYTCDDVHPDAAGANRIAVDVQAALVGI